MPASGVAAACHVLLKSNRLENYKVVAHLSPQWMYSTPTAPSPVSRWRHLDMSLDSQRGLYENNVYWYKTGIPKWQYCREVSWGTATKKTKNIFPISNTKIKTCETADKNSYSLKYYLS